MRLLIGWIFLYSSITTSFLLFFAEHFFEYKKHLWRNSQCDFCQTKLSYLELIPIFSFAKQLGKSRCCKQKLARYYFICEIIGPLFITVLFLKFGLSVTFFYWVVLFKFLLFFTITDYLYMYIPLRFLYVLFAFLIVWNSNHLFFYQSLIIGCFFYGILFCLFRRGIGSGDIQLFIIYGAALGWQRGYLLFVISIFLGLITTLFLLKIGKITSSEKIPFVPFIFLSFIIIAII